jgi:hypothetical protein
MKSTSRLTGSALLLALSVIFGGCAKDNTDTTAPTAEAQYVGSDACKPCHQEIWDAADRSGHAHMLTPVVNAHKPAGPLILPANAPPGTTWADIKYVIGGWGWKARFVGADGKIVKGAAAQYNVPTEQYPLEQLIDVTETTTSYDYACFRCHTTGPQQASDIFAEPGVRCEACHGPGSLHAATPTRASVILDDSAELCGQCHSRGGGRPVKDASGNFIDNYDQYAEMKSGPHKDLKCVDCHAEHSGVRRDQTGGIVKRCQGCHSEVRASHFGDVDCITCHMPYATKSARSRDKYVADVRTHIFKIHPGPEDQTQVFDEAGAVKDGYGVTLDYVCYQCHKTNQGVGGPNSSKTLLELSAKARLIHIMDGKAADGR